MPSALTPFFDCFFAVYGCGVFQFSFAEKDFQDLCVDDVVFHDENIDWWDYSQR